MKTHRESAMRRWRAGVRHLPAKGHQRSPAKHQELGEVHVPSPASSEEHGPARLLKPDFWPPARRDNTFLSSQATGFVVLCYRSPNKLTRHHAIFFLLKTIAVMCLLTRRSEKCVLRRASLRPSRTQCSHTNLIEV